MQRVLNNIILLKSVAVNDVMQLLMNVKINFSSKAIKKNAC